MSPPLDWLDGALLALVGFVAGVINVVAGGGSFLTLPVLLLSGVTLEVANGTNRVAVVLQSLLATKTFYDRGHFQARLYLRLLPLLALGALIGAGLATRISPNRLKWMFGALFIIMGVAFLRQEQLKAAFSSLPAKTRNLRHLVLFLIGVYGGFLQAGVGLWIVLCVVSMFGSSSMEANSVKLPLVLSFTLPAVAVFASSGQIEPARASVLGLGTALGAWVGVRVTLKTSELVLTRCVSLAMILTGAYLALF